MNYPIKTPSGNTYITIVDVNEDIFHIKLDTYQNLSVVLDKKCISDMIKALELIKGDRNASTTST